MSEPYKSFRGRPADTTGTEYFVLVLDSENYSVLVHRPSSSSVTFIRLRIPERPDSGRLMSEYCSKQLENLTGTPYELILLHATMYDIFQRQISFRYALFECMAPLCPKIGLPCNPQKPSYEFMSIDDILRLRRKGVIKFAYDYDIQAAYAAARSQIKKISEDGLRPWEVPGWHLKFTRKATMALDDLGYGIVGRFEQYKISKVAAVLRADTSKGRVYLKCSHKREGRTMATVARFAPFLVPQPLYVNEEEEWMLMDDYGETMMDRLTLVDFDRIAILLGRLQLASMNHIEDLEAIGLRRQSYACINDRLDKMLASTEIVQGLEKLNGGDSRVKQYRDVCFELLKLLYVELGLPMCLVHGDLWDNNIITSRKDSSQYILYDWGSATIDLPFSEVQVIKAQVVEEGKPNLGMDSYLKLWAVYGTVEQMRAVCQATSLKCDILDYLDAYDYAQRNLLRPCLTEKCLKDFHATLSTLHDTVSSLKRCWNRC